MKISNQQKGQVAIVLVLIMTVVSALAVTLASRSTVDTRIQQVESLSVQALLHAETGIEQLIMNPGDSSSGSQDAEYYAVKSDVGSENLEVGSIEAGNTIEVNIIGAVNLDGFAVYWRPDSSNPDGQPAVLISLIESLGAVTDRAFDYGGLNGFTAANSGPEGYAKTSGTIPVTVAVQKIRITVLGSPASLKVVPVGAGALFPSQIKSIRSIGSIPSNNNLVKYGLQYDESVSDSVPTIFDYVLFSSGSITQ